MLRIFLITQNEPIYAPTYLSKVIQRIQHRLVGVTALSPGAKQGWPFLLKQRLAMYGARDFLRASCLYGSHRLMGLLPAPKLTGRFYSVSHVAKYHSIPLYSCENVNDSGYIERLKALKPDVVVSIAANQRFGKALLRVPRLVCLNVHSSLLPDYRGLDGLFWALVHNESQVGVTVHVMSSGFDDGGIVEQRALPVAVDDTLHSLYFRAMDVGTGLLARALDRFATEQVVALAPNDVSTGRYFSWPTREAAQQFRKNGRKFF